MKGFDDILEYSTKKNEIKLKHKLTIDITEQKYYSLVVGTTINSL